MIKVYYMPVKDKINYDIFEQLLCLVSAEKKTEILKLHCEIDKKLSLYAEVLLRKIVIETYDIRNEKIRFKMDCYGKPYIADNPDFHFNISHTHNAIALAWGDTMVGIDIEKIREINLKIIDRFFTKDEIVYIRASNNPDAAFYEIWTSKEAYTKYVGTGLLMPLNSFSVLDYDLKKILHQIW